MVFSSKHLLAGIATMLASFAFAETYYVSPTGNDNNAGTSDAPVATIKMGISKATADGDIVSIADGDYETAQVQFSKAITIQGNVADCSKVVVNCKGIQDVLRYGGTDGLTVSGLTFTNINRVIYSKNATTVSHCAFLLSTANAYGGAALCFPAGTATGLKLVEDCVFEDVSTKSDQKGAIYLDGTFPITIRRSVFRNCSAGNNGGAIGQNGGSGIVLTAESCEFSNCQGVTGAVFLQANSGKTATFRNCLFAGNTSRSSASDGGSAVYTKSAALYENCTFADNGCPNSTGDNSAAVRNNGGTTTFTNCLFWANTKKADSNGKTEISYAGGAYTATSCAAPAAAPLTGDTNVALSASPFAGAGVYTLASIVEGAANPCIDGGTTLPWMTGAKDLAGADRIVNGVPDIGAYEYGGVVKLPAGFLMYLD